MNRQPVFILCICFIAGVFLQDAFRWTVGLGGVLFLGSLVLTLVLTFSKVLLFQKLKGIGLGLIFFSLGMVLHAFHSVPLEVPHLQGKETLAFQLNKKLNSNEKNKRYEVSFFKENKVFKAVLSVPKSQQELDFAHYYQAEVYLNRVAFPKQDYQFNYAQYLSRKKIYYQAYAIGTIQMADKERLSFSERIKQLRLNILQSIDRSILSAKSREFLKGIILADRTEMDKETIADFSKTGLVHILAISGGHIAVIFGVLYWFSRRLSFGKKPIAILMSLFCIWLFAVLIDYGNPVIRACIMLTIYYAYHLLQRKPDMLHALSLSALMILLWDSHQLFDVGFQLSFIAVLGIYGFYQPILKRLPPTTNRWIRMMYSIIGITISAQLATLPLVLYYFHQYSLVSFVANLVVIPLVQIIITFSFILTILIGIGFVFPELLWIYDHFILLILKLIGWFSSWELAWIENIPFSIWEVILLFLSLYRLRKVLVLPNLRNGLYFGTAVLLLMILKIGLDISAYHKSEAMVHHHFKERYFSVKQNDKVTFWVRENADMEKVKQYIISPYMVSRRAKNYEVKPLSQKVKMIEYEGKIYRFDNN